MVRVLSPIKEDKGIYMYMPLERFLQFLFERSIVLSHPSKWDNPADMLFLKSVISSKKVTSFDNLAFNASTCYIQCWSATRSSDKMWRTYSNYGKTRCVKICTTINKLKRELSEFIPSGHYNFILDNVTYCAPQTRTYNKAINHLIDEYRYRLTPQNTYNTALLLTKSKEYSYEKEVRLIVHTFSDTPPESIKIDVKPSKLITKVEVDPWMSQDDRLLQSIKSYIKPYLTPNILRTSKMPQDKPFQLEY